MGFFDGLKALLITLTSIWAFWAILWMAGKIRRHMDQGATPLGALLREIAIWVGAPLVVVVAGWAVFWVGTPLLEDKAPEAAARSDAGRVLYGWTNDPETIPLVGDWLESGEASRSGEQVVPPAGEQVVPPAGEQVVPPVGEQTVGPYLPTDGDLLHQCVYSNLLSMRYTSRIANAELPYDYRLDGAPAGYADWLPSGAPDIVYIHRHPDWAKNYGLITHPWFGTTQIKVEGDLEKVWRKLGVKQKDHPIELQDEGNDTNVYYIKPTGEWPAGCWITPDEGEEPVEEEPVEEELNPVSEVLPDTKVCSYPGESAGTVHDWVAHYSQWGKVIELNPGIQSRDIDPREVNWPLDRDCPP